MLSPGDHLRAEAEIAEAAAMVAIGIADGVLYRYLAGQATIGDVLRSLSFTGAEADRVLQHGWDFLDTNRRLGR